MRLALGEFPFRWPEKVDLCDCTVAIEQEEVRPAKGIVAMIIEAETNTELSYQLTTTGRTLQLRILKL